MTHGRFRSTGGWRNSFAPGEPRTRRRRAQLHRRGSRAITEVPIATVPGIRFPFYSTIHFAFGRASFDASYALVRRGRPQFTYELHSIDLADCAGDGLEERYPGISRHPCLKQSVQREYRVPALRDPPFPAGLHADRRCATWSDRRGRMRIYFLLVDEPFYTPACLAPLLERWRGSIVGAGFPAGFFDWKRVKTTLALYGPVGTATRSVRMAWASLGGGAVHRLFAATALPAQRRRRRQRAGVSGRAPASWGWT